MLGSRFQPCRQLGCIALGDSTFSRSREHWGEQVMIRRAIRLPTLRIRLPYLGGIFLGRSRPVSYPQVPFPINCASSQLHFMRSGTAAELSSGRSVGPRTRDYVVAVPTSLWRGRVACRGSESRVDRHSS